jgi:hypothetical protein
MASRAFIKLILSLLIFCGGCTFGGDEGTFDGGACGGGDGSARDGDACAEVAWDGVTFDGGALNS